MVAALIDLISNNEVDDTATLGVALMWASVVEARASAATWQRNGLRGLLRKISTV